MLKYVRLSHPTKGEIIVFTLAPLHTSQLAKAFEPIGCEPLSAGFVTFDQEGTARVHGESVSLNLKPDLGDAARIGALYRAMSRTSVMSGVPITGNTPGDDAINS